MELDELGAFVTIQKLFSQVDNTEITRRQAKAIEEFCKFLQEPIPDKFTLEPCNSVGVLLHWKALLLIAASLTEEERGYWRKNFQAPEDAELQDVQPAVQQRINPEAFDSHFHLDSTLREMFHPPHGTLNALRVNWIGFHPKHARNSIARIDEGVRQFRRLLRHPRVVAFGDVGLDHSVPLKYWAYQVELLEKVLPYLEDRRTQVLGVSGRAFGESVALFGRQMSS